MPSGGGAKTTLLEVQANHMQETATCSIQPSGYLTANRLVRNMNCSREVNSPKSAIVPSSKTMALLTHLLPSNIYSNPCQVNRCRHINGDYKREKLNGPVGLMVSIESTNKNHHLGKA